MKGVENSSKPQLQFRQQEFTWTCITLGVSGDLLRPSQTIDSITIMPFFVAAHSC